MNISLNNRPEKIDKAALTVQELIDYKNFTFKMLVVKVNGQLVRKENYAHVEIQDGDAVAILHMISGG
ncbi:sulfur carrier protein ThiS [Bacteroidota bacterium]